MARLHNFYCFKSFTFLNLQTNLNGVTIHLKAVKIVKHTCSKLQKRNLNFLLVIFFFMLQLGVKGLMDSVYIIELSLPGWPMSAVHYIVPAAIIAAGTHGTLPFESPCLLCSYDGNFMVT